MKVLMLNGSWNNDGSTKAGLEEMAKTFAAEGVETEIVDIGAQPIADCISFLRSQLLEEKGEEYDAIIYTSPDGKQFDQEMANSMSQLQNIIILCGHYKGIDHRIREHLVTHEVSIGDYVLSGGELPAAVMTDAIVRVIPGVLGDSQAALDDCFMDNLLAPPIYTRPAHYDGFGDVPEILLCGDPKKIREWELQQAMDRTRQLRPDLLEK